MVGDRAICSATDKEAHPYLSSTLVAFLSPTLSLTLTLWHFLATYCDRPLN